MENGLMALVAVNRTTQRLFPKYGDTDTVLCRTEQLFPFAFKSYQSSSRYQLPIKQFTVTSV